MHQVPNPFIRGLTIIDKEDPTILSVTTESNKHSGSIEGNTVLIIKGTSFHSDFNKNSIWVGPYPCLMMADGSKENSLSCRTTKAYDPSKYYNLAIKVAVDGKNEVVCSTDNCKYSYRNDQTPFIE